MEEETKATADRQRRINSKLSLSGSVHELAD
jgi:hypothetical protein